MRPQEDLKIVWQPFQLNPTMPMEGMERKSYLAAKFGGLDRAERQNERLFISGKEEGIDFNFEAITKTPNTIDSHRLIRLADQTGHQNAVVEALFRGFFYDGLDLGDLDTLVDIGTASGLEESNLRRYLHSNEDRAEIHALDERARQDGITGVPCFVFEGKYAVSGAQSPEIFHQIINLARHEAEEFAGNLAAE